VNFLFSTDFQTNLVSTFHRVEKHHTKRNRIFDLFTSGDNFTDRKSGFKLTTTGTVFFYCLERLFFFEDSAQGCRTVQSAHASTILLKKVFFMIIRVIYYMHCLLA